jgi:hypothetical protein
MDFSLNLLVMILFGVGAPPLLSVVSSKILWQTILEERFLPPRYNKNSRKLISLQQNVVNFLYIFLPG